MRAPLPRPAVRRGRACAPRQFPDLASARHVRRGAGECRAAAPNSVAPHGPAGNACAPPEAGRPCQLPRQVGWRRAPHQQCTKRPERGGVCRSHPYHGRVTTGGAARRADCPPHAHVPSRCVRRPRRARHGAARRGAARRLQRGAAAACRVARSYQAVQYWAGRRAALGAARPRAPPCALRPCLAAALRKRGTADAAAQRSAGGRCEAGTRSCTVPRERHDSRRARVRLRRLRPLSSGAPLRRSKRAGS